MALLAARSAGTGARPSTVLGVNWSNPLSNGLRGAYAFNEGRGWPQNYAARRFARINGLNPFPTWDGLGYRLGYSGISGETNNGAETDFFAATGAPGITSGAFSIGVAYRLNSTANATRRVVQGSNNWLIGPYTGAHKMYTGSGFIVGPSLGVVGEQVWCLATYLGTTYTFYVNGISQGTGTSTSYPGDIGLGIVGGFSEAAGVTLLSLFVWFRALTSSEARELYAPATRWNLFLVPSTRVFFDVGAAVQNKLLLRLQTEGLFVGSGGMAA